MNLIVSPKESTTHTHTHTHMERKREVNRILKVKQMLSCDPAEKLVCLLFQKN